MTQEHDSGQSNSRLRVFAEFGLVTVALCVIAFWAGRFTAPTSPVASYEIPQKGIHRQEPEHEGAVSNEGESPSRQQLSSEDADRLREINELYTAVSEENWQLVSPLAEYEAGRISSAELREQTAVPEVEILRRCTRMLELSTELDDSQQRNEWSAVCSAILLRHRGLSMIIEGIAADDESKVEAGSKLFEQGRNDAIAATLQFQVESPTRVMLEKLSDAYHDDK